ncbi:MAG: hypothetical protein GHHEDOFH_01561 [Pseudorhodoplanes sp.]|nr:hypothetical protein [Pseudorhodoplanes sp.]
MAKKPDEPKVRYHVEYLDWAKGKKLAAERGHDAETDGLWEFVDQGEITVCRPFGTKTAAVAWALQNAKLDVFNMPRVREQTLTMHTTDDRGRVVQPWLSWDTTGYWEADGVEEIETDLAA